MAEVALSRCVSVNYTDSRGHRMLHHITYSFEFIDDYVAQYSNMKGFMRHIGLKSQRMPVNEQSLDSVMYTFSPSGNIDSDTITRLQQQDSTDDDDDAEAWMQSSYNAENHVLNLMVSRNQL